MKIYLELLREGISEYNGETIVFTDSLVKKNLDLENIKEITSAINKSIMREKITEDQIIDKLVKMIDEIDKFINFVTLKKEESETLIKYSDKIDPGATKLFQELEENLLNYRKNWILC